MIRCGFVADVHVGSAFAPWPEDCPTSLSEKAYPLNVGQRYLLQQRDRIVESLPEMDILVVSGDAVDGKAPKDEGLYICEPDTDNQVDAFLQWFEPINAKCTGERYVTEGTRYHEAVGSSLAHRIAKELNAIPMTRKRAAWDWLLLDVGGVRLDIAHRQTVTIGYRSMPIEREMLYSEMHTSPADIVVRSHSHNYLWLELARERRIQYGLSTAAWQLQNNYCRTSISPNRKDGTMLGMIVLEIEAGEIGKRNFLFQHPPMRRATYAKSKGKPKS